MKKTLLIASMAAVCGTMVAQEITATDMAQKTEEMVNLSTDEEDTSISGEEMAIRMKRPAATSTVADSVWYARPKGCLTRSTTKYDETSGGTNEGGGFATFNAAILSVPVHRDIIFPNKCKDKVASQWGFNNAHFGEAGYFTPDNDGLRSFSKVNGSYYTAQVKLNETIFYWGEEAYTSATLSTDSIIAMMYEEKGSKISQYTYFTGPSYAFGTSDTNFDFDKDGTAETVHQYGVRIEYPKPIAPLSFDYIFIPALTDSTNKSCKMFQNGATIRLTITSTASGDTLWSATAGDGDFTNGTGSSATMVEYGNLKFQQLYEDVFGEMAAIPCTINEDYTVTISGFQDPGVHMGFRFLKRSTYEQKDAPVVERLYQNDEGESVGYLVWNANTYGLPLNFHGFYDVIDIIDAYTTSSGTAYEKMNIIKIANNGESCVAEGGNVDGAQLYTQLRWFNAAGDENYGIEKPEWVLGYEAVPSTTSNFVKLAFTAEPLPEGVTGRGCKVYVESIMGGIADMPIYLLQGDYTAEQVDADETTGITTARTKATATNTACYNLAGQRIDSTAKGLTIKNGVLTFRK